MTRSTVQRLTLAVALLHAMITCASFWVAWETAALKKQAAENVELKRQLGVVRHTYYENITLKSTIRDTNDVNAILRSKLAKAKK